MAASVDNFNDLKELGIDCDANDSLTDAFNKAANHLQTILPNLDNQDLLTLYGYYKQGSQGCCNTQKPSWFDMKAKSKWEAWNKLGNMSQHEAKKLYIETIRTLDPNFDKALKEYWISVSVLQNNQNLSESDKNIVDYIKEGNSTEVSKMLQSLDVNDRINKIDENGLALIHWAADSGSIDIISSLIKYGADINLQDSEGQTALHYASSCGHIECVKWLLSNNAQRDILDNENQTPQCVASDAAVKELLK